MPAEKLLLMIAPVPTSSTSLNLRNVLFWTDSTGIFSDLPNVRVAVVHQSESKELRAERAAVEFGHHRVLFEERMPELERQLSSFPAVKHDDDIDNHNKYFY